MEKEAALKRLDAFKKEVAYKNDAKIYTITCYAYLTLLNERLSFEKLDWLYEGYVSSLNSLESPYKYIKDETRRRKLLLDFPNFFKIHGDINGEKHEFFVELRHK